MNKFFSGALLITSLALAVTTSAVAQSTARVRVAYAKQKGKTVSYTLISSKPFYVGNNVYVLYIGNKQFAHSEQWDNDGKGMMNFLIPAEEYKTIAHGSKIYLSYGHLSDEERATIDDLVKQQVPTIWPLGTFSKK